MNSDGPALTPPREAVEILSRLRAAGHEALLCGGCVRDALLGREPKDYDIATSAPPDEVERLFPKTVPIGRSFGVMLVLGQDGGRYEVATFRTDGGYADGRRPDAVAFTDAREDALRRDFTMNALFYDPFEGRVIDFVDGQADIRRRVLRSVGDPTRRFREDHLRLLRAARFAARTGFAIEEKTWAAMRSLAGLAATVAPERIAAELEGMLTGGAGETAFALLMDAGLLRQVLPEAAAMAGVPQPPEFHPEGDAWVHTLLLLRENDRAGFGAVQPLDHTRFQGDPEAARQRGDFTPDWYTAAVADARAGLTESQGTALAWAALLHDIGKPGTITHEDRIRFNDHDRLGGEMASVLLERLRRPRKIIDSVHDLIRRHMHVSTFRKMRKSKLRRWLAEEDFPLHLELHRMDCVASHGLLGNWQFGVSAWREERARPPVPEPLLRGGDVLALGCPPGPRIGEILRAVEDARLEGAVSSKAEALGLAKQLLAGVYSDTL